MATKPAARVHREPPARRSDTINSAVLIAYCLSLRPVLHDYSQKVQLVYIMVLKPEVTPQYTTRVTRQAIQKIQYAIQ